MLPDRKVEGLNLDDPTVLPVTYDSNLQRPVLFTPLLDRFMRLHETVALDFNQISFNGLRRDLVTSDDLAAVRGAMLIESHNPVYTSRILDSYKLDLEMATFEVIWGEEEVKHFALLHSYLEANEVDLTQLRAQVLQTRKGPWGDREMAFSRVQGFTYAMMQEQFTARFYRRFADFTNEPVLQGLLRLIAKDEYRHCQFYLEKAKDEVARDPRKMKEVDQIILDFNMPGPTFVQDFDEVVWKPGLKVAPVDVEALREGADKISQLTGRDHLRELAIKNPRYALRLHRDFGVSLWDILRAA